MENSDKDLQRSHRQMNIDNCSQELLKLVARGSAIICEILRLKDYIPEPFANKNEEKNYKDIINDFSIFKGQNLDKLEEKLSQDNELREKDEDFRINNIEVIDRFFQLFFSIYQYISDWKTFVEKVNKGNYVQHTIDTILVNKNIRPLFCESVFSAGVMLLLVDKLIPGPIREKLITSYYRYKGQSTIPHFNEIFKLFERTGYIPVSPLTEEKEEIRPKKYPVDYFKRCELDVSIIQKINATIIGNDIYDQQQVYPTTNEYKTVAFSQQASILVVSLFFTPETLEKDSKNMYDIVSKHFHDNYVISIYMGYTIDINEYWKDFKKAHAALDFNKKNNTMKDAINENVKKIKELDDKIKGYLNEGVMTEESVLNQIEILLNIMRDANVVLRFFLLQRNMMKKSVRDLFNENPDIRSKIASHTNLLLEERCDCETLEVFKAQIDKAATRLLLRKRELSSSLTSLSESFMKSMTSEDALDAVNPKRWKMWLNGTDYERLERLHTVLCRTQRYFEGIVAQVVELKLVESIHPWLVWTHQCGARSLQERHEPNGKQE